MRSSTASIILAFCAILAVQAAPLPVNAGTSIVSRGTTDFEYDADGNEIESRGTSDFEYDADGNEIEARGTSDFEYDADGNEIEKRGTSDFEYDADGNEIDARGTSDFEVGTISQQQFSFAIHFHPYLKPSSQSSRIDKDLMY